MPFDSQGNHSLPDGTIVRTGDKVLPSQHNPAMLDLSAGLSVVLKRDGRDGMVGNLTMGGFQIHNLADGSSADSAATKGQLDAISNALGNASGLDVGTTAGTVAAGDDPRFDPWAMQPIGVPIPMMSDLIGVVAPPKDKAYRYVLLTAGEAGSGEYNEGILTGESVSGFSPLQLATAVISLAGSPINGRTIRLINTERRFLRAASSVNVGTAENDQMQQITGSFDIRSSNSGTSILATGIGAMGVASSPDTGTTVRGEGDIVTRGRVSFNSANSSGARTGNETRPKNLGVTYYMRIK